MKIPAWKFAQICVVSQGDGNIRYFEVTTEKPYLQYLMEFRSPTPQKGLGKSSMSTHTVLSPYKHSLTPLPHLQV